MAPAPSIHNRVAATRFALERPSWPSVLAWPADERPLSSRAAQKWTSLEVREVPTRAFREAPTSRDPEDEPQLPPRPRRMAQTAWLVREWLLAEKRSRERSLSLPLRS
jgi:hypothetical protein